MIPKWVHLQIVGLSLAAYVIETLQTSGTSNIQIVEEPKNVGENRSHRHYAKDMNSIRSNLTFHIGNKPYY